MAAPAIRTEGLRKIYPLAAQRLRRSAAAGQAPAGEPPAPREVVALRGLDLEIGSGELFGLLGPNGAGKTTAIGILTTRVRATAGTARVAGAEVGRDPVAVKQRIGVVPQRPNPDRALTTLENLVFHAAYFGIGRGEALERARRLLDQLELAPKAAAKVDQLSGGQQQRLMIARALIHDPEILFLDEPTVGLDPQARLALWDVLRRLHSEGRTILLTTHYMEEADRLCDRLAILDRGQLLALDTPAGLKARAPGGTLIELVLDGDAQPAAAAASALPGILSATADTAVLRAYAGRPGEAIGPLVRAAEGAGRAVRDVHLSPPSLETLFVSLTGRRLE
jgi:ABC-2 type transport system ATP-binding protein